MNNLREFRRWVNEKHVRRYGGAFLLGVVGYFVSWGLRYMPSNLDQLPRFFNNFLVNVYANLFFATLTGLVLVTYAFVEELYEKRKTNSHTRQ
jgi:hypothetical protein